MDNINNALQNLINASRTRRSASRPARKRSLMSMLTADLPETRSHFKQALDQYNRDVANHGQYVAQKRLQIVLASNS